MAARDNRQAAAMRSSAFATGEPPEALYTDSDMTSEKVASHIIRYRRCYIICQIQCRSPSGSPRVWPYRLPCADMLFISMTKAVREFVRMHVWKTRGHIDRVEYQRRHPTKCLWAGAVNGNGQNVGKDRYVTWPAAICYTTDQSGTRCWREGRYQNAGYTRWNLESQKVGRALLIVIINLRSRLTPKFFRKQQPRVALSFSNQPNF